MGEPEHGASPIFATTRWTVVLQAAHPDAPESHAALETLCRAYWYPLYAYLRRQGFSLHEAQDLTQEFFAKVLAKNYLGLADRQRGRFRSFLITAFKCFLANEWDRSRALKRGAGQVPLSLDGMSAEERYRHEPADGSSADQLYDRRWALDLIERARQRLADDYARRGKQQRFESLQAFLPGSEPARPLAEIGPELGLSENAVKQEIFRLKKGFGDFLREEVAETVATPSEIDDELRYLIDVLCRR